MTLEEKAAQLGSAWIFQLLDSESFSREKTRALAEHGLGHVTRLSGREQLRARGCGGVANDIQRFLVDGRGSASRRSCTRRSARA